MNIFFAACGIVLGVAAAGSAMLLSGRKKTVSIAMGGGRVMEVPVQINKYQLYLFLAEFLTKAGHTKPQGDTLTPYEFYRITHKLINAVQSRQKSGGEWYQQ